jgi:membrane-associated protein
MTIYFRQTVFCNKFMIVFAIALVLNSAAFAQNKVFTVQTQYETNVKETPVTLLPGGNIINTDAKGRITLPDATVAIKILADGYDSTAVLLATADEGVVKVKKSFSWKDLLTPMFYIINGGLWLILFIVFAETGLFAGFFLPGDSLLFVAGIYNHELVESVFPFVKNEYMQLMVMWLLISLAGIIGNSVGYWFGRKVGPAMYSWKDNMLFKQKYLQEAHDFYEKHGGGAIVIARFLPIVRTFAPIVAGIVKMDKSKFTFYNIAGCLAWVLSMLVAGHFLQKWILSQFHFNLKEHLEVIVIGIVLVTTAPVFVKLFMSKRKK